MPSLRATRPLLLLTLSLVTLRVEATCYWQNSPTLAIDDPDAIAQDDTACFPDQDNSPCCGTGWTCLSDGVCKIKQDDTTFYYRGTCTDRTWDSQQCPGWCFAQNANSSIPMAKCDSEQDWYCCPGDADCDCDTGKNAVKLGADQPTTVTVIGSTSWPGMTSTASAFTDQPLNTEGTSTTGDASASTTILNNSAATATGSNLSPTAEGAQATSSTADAGTSSDDSSSNNTTALAAGLGAGLGAAAVLVAGGIFYLFRRRRRNQGAAGAAGAANAKTGAYYDNDGERSSGSTSAPVFKGGAAPAGAGAEAPPHDFYASEGRKPPQQQQPVAELAAPGQGHVEMDSGQRARAELP